MLFVHLQCNDSATNRHEASPDRHDQLFNQFVEHPLEVLTLQTIIFWGTNSSKNLVRTFKHFIYSFLIKCPRSDTNKFCSKFCSNLNFVQFRRLHHDLDEMDKLLVHFLDIVLVGRVNHVGSVQIKIKTMRNIQVLFMLECTRHPEGVQNNFKRSSYLKLI